MPSSNHERPMAATLPCSRIYRKWPVAMVEDLSYRRESGLEDPALGFLGIPHEKLSNSDDAIQSRSLTDDEAPFDGVTNHSLRRRSTKSISMRSTKSQASTPPSADGP